MILVVFYLIKLILKYKLQRQLLVISLELVAGFMLACGQVLVLDASLDAQIILDASLDAQIMPPLII